LLGFREDSDTPCEILLLKRLDINTWEALVKPGRRLKTESCVVFGNGELRCRIQDHTDFGGRNVQFIYNGVFEEILDRLGRVPLPPYIHTDLQDKNRYQTVYAKEEGSAAAPTAGLHFTQTILDKLKRKGVIIESLLLHVGLGTFRPVKEENVKDHVMHQEMFSLSAETALSINKAKAQGGRVVCVGTTSVRVLETLANHTGNLHAGSGSTRIFITPGYQFKIADMLLTNFHLPKSTLLMLVSAFMGKENALYAYQQAVDKQYRFFSFGDCMLIGSNLV
jgi:S-adenosylmethionine:tRNA ribosyltransferase-isomerase